MQPVAVIKKYPNRRLYDPDPSRYITLEELAEKIRSGRDVVIVDASSGEDLTQTTLTQVILESRGGARLLPVPLLLQLIRLGDGVLADFFGRYLSWSLETYLSMRSSAAQMMPWNPLMAGPSGVQALARMMPMGMPMGMPIGMGSPFGGQERAPGPPAMSPDGVAPPPPPPLDDDEPDQVDVLRREIDELRRVVQGASAARPRAKPSKKTAKKRSNKR